jgi:hypothetical protein
MSQMRHDPHAPFLCEPRPSESGFRPGPGCTPAAHAHWHRPGSRACYFRFPLLSCSNRSAATFALDAGFCPVIRFPSTTAYSAKLAPCE